MRVLIGAFAFVILAGCGSSPVSSDRADPVPAKRLYAYDGQSDAQLIVVRDGGLYGAGCNYRFISTVRLPLSSRRVKWPGLACQQDDTF